MNRISRTLGLAIVAAFGMGALARSQDAPGGDPANGEHLYLAVGCFTCHGRAGQGGNYNYPVPAIAHLEWPVEALTAFLRAAPNDMPAYAQSVLSDRDVADIHAFLRSLPGPRPVADIPLLNQ
jgi:mono/diheme cytochrome c family protein